MTKKHFIAFAADIKEGLKDADTDKKKFAVDCQINLVCRMAKKFNSEFDEMRFRKACGL